jgi:hypothetical protein
MSPGRTKPRGAGNTRHTRAFQSFSLGIRSRRHVFFSECGPLICRDQRRHSSHYATAARSRPRRPRSCNHCRCARKIDWWCFGASPHPHGARRDARSRPSAGARRAGTVASIGAGVGLLSALALSRLFTSLLFRVSPTDPIALGGACVVLLGTATVAAYLPARRATLIDPVQALRAD